MSIGASGDRDPAPVESTPVDPTRWTEPARWTDPTPIDPTLSDPTRLDPTRWSEPMPPVNAGYAAYPAQYPPEYPDLGSGPSPAGYPPPVHPSPVYPSSASYPPYDYPATRRTNSLAIAALVLSFAFWPAGIVAGHVARRQIARSGEPGSGLATAALIIGYLHLAFIALLIVVGVTSGG